MEAKDYGAGALESALLKLTKGVSDAQTVYQELADEIRNLRQSFGTNNSNANVSFNDSGKTVWIATTACVVTVIVSIVAMIFINQNVTTAFIASSNEMAAVQADLRDAKAYNTLHESRIKKLEINNEHSNNH